MWMFLFIGMSYSLGHRHDKAIPSLHSISTEYNGIFLLSEDCPSKFLEMTS